MDKTEYPPVPGWGYEDWPGARPRSRSRTWVRRRVRMVRRLTATVMGLAIVGAMGVGGLLLVTPSVANAQALAKAFDRAHRVAYPGPPVPAKFAAALTSTEDHRFYSEPGIDMFALGRLVLGKVLGQPDQGGSTLYVQLGKMLYTSGHPGVIASIEGFGLGIKLYLTYTHAQILRMYSDVAYFGHGYYGLAAASCGYFGVRPAHLAWPEATMLAGLVQAPSVYDPIAHYAAGRSRQEHVLLRLVATNTITQVQAARFYSEGLHLVGGSGNAC